LRRRSALNLSLALLAAGFVVIVLLIPAGQEPEIPNRLDFDPNQDVRSIQVERVGKPRLAFVREAGGWLLRAPVVAPAHPHRIRDLLALPTLPASARLEINDDDLRRFGLNPPLATLSLDQDTFEFGITDGLDDRRYIRYQRQVHLVPDTLYPQLTQGANFFIDTRLLKEGLRPERISAPHRVVWLEGDVWRSDPAQATGEPPAAAIAPAWETAQALAVTSGTGADGGQRITLAFAQGITIEFDAVEQDEEVFLLRRDLNLRYQLDQDHAMALMVTPGVVAPVPVTP